MSVTTPYFVKAEAYGGLRAARGPAAQHRRASRRDGVWRGDRTGYDPSLYPPFQPAAIAPAFGVALESTGVTWIHGRLTYRRVYDTGASNADRVRERPLRAGRLRRRRASRPRSSATRSTRACANVGGAKAGIVYDLYNAEVTVALRDRSTRTSGKKVTVSADYDYYVPTFDADSIWNFFAGEPMNDLGLRANVDVDRPALHRRRRPRARLQRADRRRSTRATAPRTRPYPNYAAGQSVYPDATATPSTRAATSSARWRTGETLRHPARQRQLGRRGRPRGRRRLRAAHLRDALRRERPHRRLAVGRQARSPTATRRASTTCSASATASRRARRRWSSGSTTSTASSGSASG